MTDFHFEYDEDKVNYTVFKRVDNLLAHICKQTKNPTKMAKRAVKIYYTIAKHQKKGILKNGDQWDDYFGWLHGTAEKRIGELVFIGVCTYLDKKAVTKLGGRGKLIKVVPGMRKYLMEGCFRAYLKREREKLALVARGAQVFKKAKRDYMDEVKLRIEECKRLRRQE